MRHVDGKVQCQWCEGMGFVFVDKTDGLCWWRGVDECVGCKGRGVVDPNEKEEEE